MAPEPQFDRVGEARTGVATPATISARYSERHYSVDEVAEMWSLSPDCVRGIFEPEPGVLIVGGKSPHRHKRRYRTLRIPESVLERVHKRLSQV
jgi:hypothetical protein